MIARPPVIRFLDHLPETALNEALALYWLAFQGKLGRVLGPDPRAMRLLSRCAMPDHAMVALSPQGRVIGVIGFRSPAGGFVVLRRRQLMDLYGRLGGRIRSWLLERLIQDTENERFLIDGLAVAEDWRGHGVGSALMLAVADEARRRHYKGLRLDVADHNLRARALYERLGFEPFRHDRMGWLGPVFGMAGSTAMVCMFDRPTALHPDAGFGTVAPLIRGTR